MIRLLAAGTRIALIVVSMAVAIPAITFAQTNESATERVPVEGEVAEGTASLAGGEDSTDKDTSVQTDPIAEPAPPAMGEAETQRETLNQFAEYITWWAQTVTWWLSATAIFLTLFAVVVAIAGFVSFKRFREIEAEVRNSVKTAAEHAEAAGGHVKEIKKKRDEADEIVRGINAQTVADNPVKANQVVANVQNNPDASPIDKAIANAISLQRQGERDDAVEKWRSVANISESSDNVLTAIAWFSVAYLVQDESPEDGISAYGKAIRFKPDFALAYYNRGTAKAKLGWHADALADYDEAIRFKPDFAEAYTNRGTAKDTLERHTDALADYDEAIRFKPDFAEAYYSRGTTKAKLGRYAAAIADFDEAIRLKPDFAEAYYNRGNAKDALGLHEDAVADFDEAIRLKPDFAEAYYNRGNAKDALGLHEDAIADYDEAIRLKPDFAEAFINRGNSKGALGLTAEARKAFEIALGLARKANDAKIVAQAEQLLRDLDAAEGS